MLYLQPNTLTEALGEMARRPLTVLAGGTDIYPALKDRPLKTDTLDISRIDGLTGIVPNSQGWRINAGATWSDVLRAPLPPVFDGLKLAAREIGSVQIQNAATVMGNLCNASPAADGVPCLLTLDARIELSSERGTRVIPLSEFITGVRKTARTEDELATAILIPTQASSALGGFLKLGSRSYLVISIAMVACVIAIEDAHLSHVRIAVGACSPVAMRLPVLEAALTGLPVSDPRALAEAVLPEHLAPLSPIDDVRGTAAYRLEAARELILRTLSQAMPRAVAA